MESEFYHQARREWDERYGDLVLGKRNWQIASAGLMLLSLILALGIVWMSARAKVREAEGLLTRAARAPESSRGSRAVVASGDLATPAFTPADGDDPDESTLLRYLCATLAQLSVTTGSSALSVMLEG